MFLKNRYSQKCYIKNFFKNILYSPKYSWSPTFWVSLERFLFILYFEAILTNFIFIGLSFKKISKMVILGQN